MFQLFFQICSMICSHSPPTYLWFPIKLFQRSFCFFNVFQLICDLHINDLQWFPVFLSLILNQSRWFLMFSPEIVVFFIGFSKRLSRISTWISLICIDLPKILSDVCLIFVFFPPPLVEKCVLFQPRSVYFFCPSDDFIRKFPYLEPI